MAVDFVSFTGHRDRLALETELDRVRESFRGAVWVHGGAVGFDSQVATYARRHQIRCVVVPPAYVGTQDREAPLIRNKVIVNASDVLIACWDGRAAGGTAFTVRYAESLGKRVIRLALAEVE